MKRMVVALLALLCLLGVAVTAEGLPRSRPARGHGPSGTERSNPTAVFSLDGVTLELTTTFLSEPQFVTSDPDATIQMATAVEREPLYRELSITAVPSGVWPPTESLPIAGSGQVEAYRAALRAHREGQLGDPREGAVMRLFNEDVVGSTSVVSLRVRGGEAVPVAISEWVTEAGPRLWIVRASRELPGRSISQPSLASEMAPFYDSALSSPNLTAPSTSLAATPPHAPLPSDTPRTATGASDLPFPDWWVGECDTVNFYAATGVAGYPLGAEYRAMKACGPRPSAYPYVQTVVDFGVGYPQLEWQCPELSKRFLYLAYGIPPYPGNGNQMVENYDGDLLEKVWNCTVGRAPQPDDVLSYGATTTYGHTSVVVASDVDASGDGTIRVIEQNSSSNGSSTLYVNDWCVTSYTGVIGWLHHPDWSVTYYGDESLTHRCATAARVGMHVFETWGDGRPADGCPSDHFSVRFSRTIDFVGGDYTFALGYDDGARLAVDGHTVIDGWAGADQHYQTHHLEAGHHQVGVEYYDRFGNAALAAFWWGPGFELVREEREGSRWYAEHWGNPELWWDPVVTAVEGDGPLGHPWSWGSPADNLPADHFSSRFRRIVAFDAGRWRFDLFADDGARFWVDDVLVVDEWQPQRAWFRPTVTLEGGNHELIVEHYENEEVADIGLDWEHVSEAVTPIGWVTSPVDGTVISSCPVVIAAQVSDEIGAVDRVEFHAFHDGHWHHLGDDDARPYMWEWDCLSVHDQRVWLTIHVWDEAGNEFVDLDGRVAVHLDHLPNLHLPLILKMDAW